MSEEVIGTQVSEEVIPAATTEQVATPETETPSAQEVQKEAEEKRQFTQAELDAIIQKEKAKAEAKAERRALKAYRETLERLVPQPQQPQASQEPGRPSRDKFASDEDWVEAVADWKLEQREAVRQKQQQETQTRSLVEKTEAIYAEAQKIPGFDREAFDELPLSAPIAAAIIESDAPAKLMAFLATNPDEVSRIAGMSPARQAAEIGKLEAKIASAPKVSSAPAPIAPVGGNKGGQKDPSEMSDAEFATWRRRQIAQRR